MRHHILYFLLLIPFVTGCGAAKAASSHEESDIREVIVREVIRDTVVVVEPDSSLTRALIECDSMGRARLMEIEQLRSSSRINTKLAISDDNHINVTTKVDSIGIYLAYKVRNKEETTVRTVTDTTVVTKEVNVLRWYQKVLIWIGLGCLLAVSAWAIVKLLGSRLNAVIKLIKQ